jgi:hypothetical protein
VCYCIGHWSNSPFNSLSINKEREKEHRAVNRKVKAIFATSQAFPDPCYYGSVMENAIEVSSEDPSVAHSNHITASSLSQQSAAINNINGTNSEQPRPRLVRRKKQYAVSVQWESQRADGTFQDDFHSYFCCCAERIGNMFALVRYPDGTPVVMAGPCWPVTLPLVLGVPAVVAYFLILNQQFSIVSVMCVLIFGWLAKILVNGLKVMEGASV